MSVRLPVLAGALLAAFVLAGPAQAASTPKRTSPKVKLSTKTTITKGANGVQHMHYVYGPVHIAPGQNSIFIAPNDLKPKVDGYIMNFAPNLILDDGTIPRVDVIHLHHAVWAVNGYATWASGEEKTIATVAPGYGWTYKTSDKWLMNHMIHDLTPSPETVYITYDMDFIPKSAPEASKVTGIHTQWMDVEGGKGYPVFDAIKGTGKGPKAKRRFTFPDDQPDAYKKDGYQRNKWVVTKPQTLVGTFGHLHPGGLYNDLKITRGGVTKLLFRSEAKYWEPAGAVSWDVSMTVPPKSWKVNVEPGDIVTTSATYDTSKASWYESMGIMPLGVADGHFGTDPFAGKIETRGKITHGPLAENRNHGGQPIGLPNPMKQLNGPVVEGKQVLIDGFIYKQGNLTGTGMAGRPPVVSQGGTFTFVNKDAPKGLTGSLTGVSGGKLPIYHTVTSCKQPCNKSTGIAYPLADGDVTFDSGELGYGPQGDFTAAAQRNTWDVPKDLPKGTYTYFCRVHPFMRGSFRVVPNKT